MHRTLVSLSLAVCVLASSAAAQTATDPKRVLIVYSTNFPDQNSNGTGDSKELADYYGSVRGVPTANRLGLKFKYPTRTYFSGSSPWASFHDELVTPVKAKLSTLGGAKNIDTILFMLGVPFRVITTATSNAERAVDSLMVAPSFLGTRSSWGYTGNFVSNPYFESSPTVGTDKGRFAHGTVKYGTHDYYLVSRLDGVHVEACKDLIDGARYFETYGSKGAGKVSGNVVLDTRYGTLADSFLTTNYPSFPGKVTYALWDYRMAWGKLVPSKMKLPLLWESTGNEIGESGAKWQDGKAASHAGETLVYGGWYNYCRYQDVFDWLPGSVGTDLNSNSLSRFRDTGYTMRSFGSGAMNHGLTASMGVISEPWLDGHVRPEVMFHYLAKGYTFAEVAAVSNPAIFWRGLQIGDPLYAPFAPGLNQRADTLAPKRGPIRVGSRSGASADLDVRMARKAVSDPELVRVEVDFGTERTFGKSVTSKKRFRSRHALRLAGLDKNEPGYYFRANLIDPAGNKTLGDIFALTPRSFDTVEVRVKAAKPTVTFGQWIDLRFSMATSSDLSKLTAAKVELQHGGGSNPWLDVTPYLVALVGTAAAGPQFESALLRLHAPLHVRGSFQVRVSAAVGAKKSTHTASFTIQ